MNPSPPGMLRSRAAKNRSPLAIDSKPSFSIRHVRPSTRRRRRGIHRRSVCILRERRSIASPAAIDSSSDGDRSMADASNRSPTAMHSSPTASDSSRPFLLRGRPAGVSRRLREHPEAAASDRASSPHLVNRKPPDLGPTSAVDLRDRVRSATGVTSRGPSRPDPRSMPLLKGPAEQKRPDRSRTLQNVAETTRQDAPGPDGTRSSQNWPGCIGTGGAMRPERFWTSRTIMLRRSQT